jgi:hypothetical protein
MTRPVIRSISQEEANKCFKEFFTKNNNTPVRYAELENLAITELSANENQASGLINRAHAPQKGIPTLIKLGREYSLYIPIESDPPYSDIVKNRIKDLHEELINIPIKNCKDTKDFEKVTEILKRLKEIIEIG